MNRIGEKKLNNFGSEIIIVEYRKYSDIDVYFPQYDWVAKGVQYGNFKNGKIKCPYERSIYGVGYLGEGKYNPYENRRATKVYATWKDMLKRCYDEKYQEKYSTYKNCSVTKEWHNFQNFAEWYYNNYYEIEGETMCLDKDILYKHNKVYSPKTCVFVPQAINKLFVKRDNDRGESVIGTYPFQGKYVAQCSIINLKTGKSKHEYLGYYTTQEKAFEVYKYYKEKNIEEVADYYKGLVPERLYNALYNYEVEITD